MRLSLIALSVILIGATAQECGSSYAFGSEEIHTQEDLDVLENDCTILLSRFEITSNFTGRFVLPGIVNITSGLRGGFKEGLPLNISDFVMPDLEFAESIFIQRLSYLKRFDVPSLEETGALKLDMDSYLDILDIPALEKTAYLNLKGNFTDVSFPALHTVTNEMIVTNRRPTILPKTSMNLSFPSLNSSSYLHVEGKASSLSFPELTSLTELGGSAWGLPGSNFSLWGEELSLDLPKLRKVGGNLAFEGNITSLSLPSLNTIQGNLTIHAGNPLSIDLPIVYAGVINLVGKIKSVELPSLFMWNALNIHSELPLDCEEILSKHDTYAPNTRVSCVAGNATDDSEGPMDKDDSSAQDQDLTKNSDNHSEENGKENKPNGDNTSSAARNTYGYLTATICIAMGVIVLLG